MRPVSNRCPGRLLGVAAAVLMLTLPLPGQDDRARAAVEAIGLPGQKEFNRCLRLPQRRSVVKFMFPPNAELQSLVAWMSGAGCARLIVPAALLKGKKVTVFAPGNITLDGAYQLFIGVLDSHGLTVEPQGKVLRIVEAARARFATLPVVVDGSAESLDDRYLTRLFRFEHLDPATVLAGLYSRLRGEKGVGAISGGSLIVTDRAAMLERFSEIVADLDQPALAREKLWMVRVRRSSARAMARRLSEIFAIRQPAGRPAHRASPRGPARAANGATTPLAEMLTISKLIPDDRTNQLIVVASEPVHELLLTILQRLDQVLDEGQNDLVHVYPCEHADCDELAATLSAITGVPLMPAVVRGRSGSRRRRAPVRTGRTAARTVASVRAPAVNLFEREVRITHDMGTNSLVVVSSRSDFVALRSLLRKLDVPRKQVYIEAVILEVLLDKSRDLGVAYHAGRTLDARGTDSLGLGGFGADRTLKPERLAGDLVGLAGAILGPALGAGATRLLGVTADLPSFGAIIKLLQRNDQVSVLSSPNLLITSNEAGEVSVGQRLPFPTGFLGPSGRPPLVSVQRQDVSLRMKLSPRVNHGNLIRLEVDVEVSDVAAEDFNGLGPATSTRSAKTAVLCRGPADGRHRWSDGGTIERQRNEGPHLRGHPDPRLSVPPHPRTEQKIQYRDRADTVRDRGPR